MDADWGTGFKRSSAHFVDSLLAGTPADMTADAGGQGPPALLRRLRGGQHPGPGRSPHHHRIGHPHRLGRVVRPGAGRRQGHDRQPVISTAMTGPGGVASRYCRYLAARASRATCAPGPDSHTWARAVDPDPPQVGPLLVVVVDQQSHLAVGPDVVQPLQGQGGLGLGVHGRVDPVAVQDEAAGDDVGPAPPASPWPDARPGRSANRRRAVAASTRRRYRYPRDSRPGPNGRRRLRLPAVDLYKSDLFHRYLLV